MEVLFVAIGTRGCSLSPQNLVKQMLVSWLFFKIELQCYHLQPISKHMLNKMFGYIIDEASQGWRKLLNNNQNVLL
jgi:hypothetical protein